MWTPLIFLTKKRWNAGLEFWLHDIVVFILFCFELVLELEKDNVNVAATVIIIKGRLRRVRDLVIPHVVDKNIF